MKKKTKVSLELNLALSMNFIFYCLIHFLLNWKIWMVKIFQKSIDGLIEHFKNLTSKQHNLKFDKS